MPSLLHGGWFENWRSLDTWPLCASFEATKSATTLNALAFYASKVLLMNHREKNVKM